MACARLTADCWPEIVTAVGSKLWSIWILAPVYCCSALMVSPARGERTRVIAWPLQTLVLRQARPANSLKLCVNAGFGWRIPKGAALIADGQQDAQNHAPPLPMTRPTMARGQFTTLVWPWLANCRSMLPRSRAAAQLQSLLE